MSRMLGLESAENDWLRAKREARIRRRMAMLETEGLPPNLSKCCVESGIMNRKAAGCDEGRERNTRQTGFAIEKRGIARGRAGDAGLEVNPCSR